MTDDDDKPKRDPFAPLPLDESLTGKTKQKSGAAAIAARRAAMLPPSSRPATLPPPIKTTTDTAPERSVALGPAGTPEATDTAIPETTTSATSAANVSDIPTLDPDPTGDGIEAIAATDAASSDTPAPTVPADNDDDDYFSFAKKTERAAKRRAEQDRELESVIADDYKDDDGTTRRKRAGIAVAALALVVGGGIAAAVLLGRVNSGRYAIVCTADHAVVEQGRVFPPWGTKPMLGGEWVPIELPPEAACTPRETENQSEVAAWFGKMLEERATTLLTARNVSGVDQAEGILKQALLVTRSLPTDDERIDARGRIERMLGDVAYWRASARLKDATDALADAAKQFDAAALQKPRYVTDAAAWAAYARKLTEDLKLGPAGANTASAFPTAPSTERPNAPLGTELPVEPGAATGSAAEPATAPPVAEPSTAPSGGVLL